MSLLVQYPETLRPGEIRLIEILFKENPVITRPEYSITDPSGAQIGSGEATQAEGTLRASFTAPATPGIYVVAFMFNVGAERFERRVAVVVSKN